MAVSANRLASVLILLLGAPFVCILALGFAEGEQRRREVPLRALLGDTAYEQLRDGVLPSLHYMGYERRAPDFTLKDGSGKPWKLSEQRGKTVVMNFWTITCQPCVEEMPSLEQLARVAAARDDLVVVAVTTDSDADSVRAVLGPDSPLKVLFDPDLSVVRERYGTRLFPETWVIDAKGVIRLRVDGKRDWSNPVALDAVELSAS